MKILQIATALPKMKYSTQDLVRRFPCELPKSVRRNVLNLGVSHRYLVDQPALFSGSDVVLDEEDLIDLCQVASQKAVDESNISLKDIGYFIAAYDANPFLSPGLSQLLVRNLGFGPYVRHTNAQGVASTAFPKALDLAEDYLAAHPRDYVLICVSGVSSYWFQNQLRGMKNVMEISCINSMEDKAGKAIELRKWVATMQFFLFGDGVAAAIVGKGRSGLTIERTVEVTNLRRKDYAAGYARLSATDEPFRFGLCTNLDKDIPKLGVNYTNLALKRLLGRKTEETIKATKKWAVHTGSQKILNLFAERLKIEPEKLKESHEVLAEFGNLAGASLPFILQKIVTSKELSEDDFVLMVGYGWGFSAATCLLRFTE